MKPQKISLIGNCQTMALTWYLQQLSKDFDVKWIKIDGDVGDKIVSGFENIKWKGRNIHMVSDVECGVERLQTSDVVIFQHLRLKTSPHYNLDQLKKYVKTGELISISVFYYNPSDPDQKFLKEMKKRAEKVNVDIPAHKLIEKHGSKITIKKFNHPHVFYFLELVREICAKLGWDYYSEEQYNQYLKEGYPFG